MAHAILSASASKMWIACGPSARLGAAIPDESSEYAIEGTIAHAICEGILRSDHKLFTRQIKAKVKKEFGKDFDKFFNKSMLRYCEAFVEHVLEDKPEKHILLVEHKLDTSSHIPEGFGTMDAGVIYLRTDDGKRWYWCLETYDLKYGKGVPVSAIENEQQMIYALGVLNDFGFIYPIEKVIMHIFQPRIDNNTDWEISATDLYEWGEEILRPAAALAFAGKGEFKAGKHCTFCKVKATCRAFAEFNLEMAKNDFAFTVLLDDFEFMEIYENSTLFEGWIKAVREHAIKEALKGKKWPGYKIVEGKSNRRYSNESLVAAKLTKAGFPLEDIYKPNEIYGLGDLEESIGPDAFAKYVTPLLIKPAGKPTLAPIESEKPVFNRAKSDFEDGFSEDIDLL
jgi:hypothetical protein